MVVWDAAIVLAKYLHTVQGQLQGRSVIGSSLDVASILRHKLNLTLKSIPVSELTTNLCLIRAG